MFDEKKYQETFAQVQASDETLLEVLNMTRKKHPGVRLTRVLVIAAVISAMLATTAFAYVGFTQYENPMVMLKTFFGSDEYKLEEGTIYTYQDEYYYYEYQTPTVENVPLDEDIAASEVAPYISDVGKSITSGDNTMTVEAHLYDSATDCGIIYYSIENPNGVTGYDLQHDGEVWWPGGELVLIDQVSGKNYIIAEETTDTKLSIAHYYASVYPGAEYVELNFYFDMEAGSLVLPLNDGGGMEYIKSKNNEILLSSIAIRVNADDMEFLREYDTDGTLLPPMVDNIESLIIHYQDGTAYIVEINTDANRTKNYTYAVQDMECETRGYTFNRVVDISKVKAVIINDVEFPVT